MINLFLLLLSLHSFAYAYIDNTHTSDTQSLETTVCPIVKKIKSLIKMNRLDKETPQFVAVAGCSAVGKSFFARKLAEILNQGGVNTIILHLDDFIGPEPVKNSILHPGLDHEKAHLVIQKINSGIKKIIKPAWDLTGPEFVKVEETLVVENVDLIIFEGIYTLCDETTYDFLKYSFLRIFMDAADEDIIEWNWQRARDIKEKSKEEFIKKTSEGMKKYRSQMESVRHYADYFVLQDANHVYSLQ